MKLHPPPLAAIVLALGTVCLPAHAYFDPNTGGLLYQIAFPIIVAVGAGWRYIKTGLMALFQRAEKPGAGEATKKNGDGPQPPAL